MTSWKRKKSKAKEYGSYKAKPAALTFTIDRRVEVLAPWARSCRSEQLRFKATGCGRVPLTANDD